MLRVLCRICGFPCGPLDKKISLYLVEILSYSYVESGMKIHNYVVRVYNSRKVLLESIPFRSPAGISCRMGLAEVFLKGYMAGNLFTETFQVFDDGTTELVDPECELKF